MIKKKQKQKNIHTIKKKNMTILIAGIKMGQSKAVRAPGDDFK